ncbi:MAG: TonB family protein [Gemmatimonadaceae bacterium]
MTRRYAMGEALVHVYANPEATMSLHLIESRQVRSETARRPGGAISSVFIHAALVAGAFALATGTPIAHAAKVPEVHTIFVKPIEPPIAVNRKQTESNSSSLSSSVNSPPTTTVPMAQFPIEIPIDIPPINASHAVIDEHTDFSYGRKVGRVGNGTEPTSGSGNDIFNAPQVDKPVIALAGFRLPKYPESLRMAGVQETVVATFVVDTLGRIETGSISIPAEAHSAFANAVRDALSGAKFRPAESGGHLVRQRVAQPFVFSLDNR